MAILLAETLITLGASLQRWCQLHKAWMPLTGAIILQPAVVPVVAIGVIKSFPYPYCQWIGVDTSQGIQQPSVLFWGNRSGATPCLPEVHATPNQAIECHRSIQAIPVHQTGQLGDIIWAHQQVQVIYNQTYHIQLVRILIGALASTASSTPLANPLAIKN